MMKIQTFEWIKYEGCKVTVDPNTPHIVRLQQEINSKIIMKTSSGEIHLKPTGQDTILIYGNTARYGEFVEES